MTAEEGTRRQNDLHIRPESNTADPTKFVRQRHRVRNPTVSMGVDQDLDCLDARPAPCSSRARHSTRRERAHVVWAGQMMRDPDPSSTDQHRSPCLAKLTVRMNSLGVRR